MKLYGLELSFPVNRVRFCFNAMGLDYELIRLSPIAGETQTEEYLKLSPSGKIPAIDDDGFGLFESNAIMKYAARKYNSDYYPADIETQANVDKWLDFIAIHVANGVGKVLFNKILAPAIGADVDEQSMKDGYGFIERFFAVVDQQLASSAYIAGDTMTIADFCLLGTVDPVDILEVDMSAFPHLEAWRKKMMVEDFYKKVHNSYNETLEAMMSAMAK